jgi:hypothetical protein
VPLRDCNFRILVVKVLLCELGEWEHATNHNELYVRGHRSGTVVDGTASHHSVLFQCRVECARSKSAGDIECAVGL